MSSRREFIMLLGGAAVAWPLAARAQQRAMPVIGFLSSSSPDLFASRLRAFHQGLSETGYVEGKNVAIEYRWAKGHISRLPVLAAELVRNQVAVIAVPASTPGALAAKAASSMIPIVFLTGGDPVQLGLVASLNRPGSNVTGVTTLAVELGQKQLELLHELIPKATAIALLVNPTNPSLSEPTTKNLQAAAGTLGLQLRVLYASTEREIDAAFTTLVQLRTGALVIGVDALFVGRSQQLAELATRYAIPTMTQFREFTVAGGLMTYGTNLADAYRQVGVYTGRILNGEKPAVLPVQQATKLELIINMKTAKAMGLAVPDRLLALADEVIE
jgi:putative tryptophan/tyrosine transport system substrate-binding protein